MTKTDLKSKLKALKSKVRWRAKALDAHLEAGGGEIQIWAPHGYVFKSLGYNFAVSAWGEERAEDHGGRDALLIDAWTGILEDMSDGLVLATAEDIDLGNAQPLDNADEETEE